MREDQIHTWQVRREWRDADGRLLRHRTCADCTIEQHVRFVGELDLDALSSMGANDRPIFDRRQPEVECVICEAALEIAAIERRA